MSEVWEALGRAPLPVYVREALGSRCAVSTCQRALPLVGWPTWLIAELEVARVSSLIGPTSWVVACPDHVQIVIDRLREQVGVLVSDGTLSS